MPAVAWPPHDSLRTTPRTGAGPAVNVPLLSVLTHGSGGELACHQDFGPLFALNLGVALRRRFGDNALLDCYVSDGARLLQWMGPVDVLQVRCLRRCRCC